MTEMADRSPAAQTSGAKTATIETGTPSLLDQAISVTRQTEPLEVQ